MISVIRCQNLTFIILVLKKVTLAECFVNNESLSSYLVRSGYAFAYRRYSKKFVPDEDYARINKIGMWSMEFDYPWDYRKSKKN